MRRHGSAGSLVAVALAAVAGVAIAASPERRDERHLRGIRTPGDSLHFVVSMRCTGGSCTAVGVRLVDRMGRVRWADSLPPALGPGVGAGLGVEVGATPARGRTWRGMALTARESGTGRAVERYFALRGDDLAPVTGWCRNPYRSNGEDSLRFIPATPYLSVIVQARVRADRAEGGIELVAERDPAGSGLAVLEVPGGKYTERLYYPELGDTVFKMSLYRAAEGEAFEPLTVTPASRIEVGRAYADLKLGAGPPPLREQWPDVHIRRLEVTIDGRHGFVEEGQFPALGLTMAQTDDWAETGALPPRRRFDRVLATVPASGDTFRLLATMLYPRRGDIWPQTTERIRMVDRRGNVQYADSMGTSLDAQGRIESRHEILAVPIRLSSGPGLRLTWESSPSDPSAPGTCRYFALRGSKWLAVTPWCSACEGPGPGDLLVSEAWQGWFGVRVPARVRLEAPEGGLELVPKRDAAHGGLAVLEICDVDTMPRQFFHPQQWEPLAPGDRLSVQLFRAPTGYGADPVTVTPSSRVRLGRLHADVTLEPWEGGAVEGQSFQILIRRLEVTIDGRHGFVEERDFPSVGLQQAG